MLCVIAGMFFMSYVAEYVSQLSWLCTFLVIQQPVSGNLQYKKVYMQNKDVFLTHLL